MIQISTQVQQKWVKQSQRPPRRQLAGASRNLRKYWTEFNCLFIIKFVNLYALSNQSAQTVNHCLSEDYILIHGIPESLHSDQGRQFELEVVSTLCHLLKIKKTCTTPYHPASDGMVEHFNRTQMAKILLSCGGVWDNYIKQVGFAYSSSPHLSTTFSPYFLVHRRGPRMPTDVLLATYTLD